MSAAVPHAPIVALMLAAGRSRRFGSDKRQIRLAAGQTLLEASCATVIAAGLPLYLALRPEDDLALLAPGLNGRVSTGFSSGVGRIDVHGAERGMGASLAEAAANLPAAIGGCLVLLADMPALRVDTLRCLAEALSGIGASGLVAPTWQGRRGHPVGFGQHWLDELAALDGDQGARDLLRRETHRLQRVPVDDPGVLLDVDTVADLIRL